LGREEGHIRDVARDYLDLGFIANQRQLEAIRGNLRDHLDLGFIANRRPLEAIRGH
jgi:hypothetical protein